MRIGWTEIIIIALIVLLLFGGKKIPELMKGLGKGVRSFKDGMEGKEEKSGEENEEIVLHVGQGCQALPVVVHLDVEHRHGPSLLSAAVWFIIDSVF